MKLLGKLFKRKKKGLITSPKLKICIIDDATTNLWDTFGISKERKDEIIAVCMQGHKLYDEKSKSYEFIVDRCIHVNEVVVSTIIFERMCEDHDPYTAFKKFFEG